MAQEPARRQTPRAGGARLPEGHGPVASQSPRLPVRSVSQWLGCCFRIARSA